MRRIGIPGVESLGRRSVSSVSVSFTPVIEITITRGKIRRKDRKRGSTRSPHRPIFPPPSATVGLLPSFPPFTPEKTRFCFCFATDRLEGWLSDGCLSSPPFPRPRFPTPFGWAVPFRTVVPSCRLPFARQDSQATWVRSSRLSSLSRSYLIESSCLLLLLFPLRR